MWIDEVPATGPAGPQIPIGETKLTAQCWLRRRELNQHDGSGNDSDKNRQMTDSIYWDLSVFMNYRNCLLMRNKT